MQDFKKLDVWQKAHRLTTDIYAITRGFPDNEAYGLISQMRRCSVSISANIAEGCGRNGVAELMRFLHISTGSACELEYYLLLAGDLKYIDNNQQLVLSNQITEIKRMISALVKTLKNVNKKTDN